MRVCWATALVASLLCGCGSVLQRDTPALSGHLSVRVENTDGPARTLSANFELSGDARQGSLSLSTPLGTIAAQARWSPQQVQLATPRGQTTYPDLPALTRELLGEELPLVALMDWLSGQPWPGAASESITAPGESGFIQLGWQIQLTRFDEGWVTAHRLQTPGIVVQAHMDQP